MDRTIQERKGKFFIGDEQEPIAQLMYDEHNGIMKIMSTVVNPSERNQGLGKELVDHAVNYARKHKIKIDPVCSFAHDVIKNTPQYHIVWAQ